MAKMTTDELLGVFEEMTQGQEKKKILLMLFLQMQDHKRYKLSKKLEA